jgi:hypothetical protein
VSLTARRILFTVGYVAVALIAVVAVGYFRYNKQFFSLSDTTLEFFLFGLMGALIYASVQMRGFGYAVVVIVFWSLVRAALNGDLSALAGPAAYTLPVGFALLAAAHLQKSTTRFRFARFLIMSVMVGAGYGLYILSHFLVGEGGLRAIWRQAVLGAELGAAVGLGFELINLFGPPPEYDLASGTDESSA